MALSMPRMPDSRNWFSPVPPSRRRRFTKSRAHGVWIEVDGNKLVNFAANDYLGLANHAEVCQAVMDAIGRSGFGSGASRLVSGDTPEFHRLEEELAAWKGYEAALIVGSGMLANMGLLDALADRHTHLFCDRLNHASLLDGARLCRGWVRRYAHLDCTQLQGLLAGHDAGKSIIVSDGVFSMDGDCADAKTLADLAERHDAMLVVDDAHGTGTMGPDGRGLLAAAGLNGHDRIIEVGTLGKALGSYGAFILGKKKLIEGLRQRMRTMIYSTALPACAAAAASAALKVILRGDVIARLHQNLRRFRALTQKHGLPLLDSKTPIQPLILGEDEKALQAAACLQQAGFFVAAIRPPTVPEGTSRLRFTISAAHSEQHIEAFVNTLARSLRT